MELKRAFTLSEVLITLVIIGVVAAITVPVLQEQYTELERISRIKKNYSVLSNAMIRVQAAGGHAVLHTESGSYSELKKWFNKYLSPYLITTKVCYNETGCWNTTGTKYLNGTNASSSNSGVGSNIITAILNDGTFINVDFWLKDDILSYFGVETNQVQAVTIYFDINGAKKPNTFGKDIFTVLFTEYGLILPFKDDESRIDTDCSSSGRGHSCIYKYLKK
ncbi:MAG: type II secretion system GspH family protein [Candidatus Gastranaerophilales bacterium]|nr:type II secretion system GspH family protein [Candidatus Gastranaerophilales bacterium]